MCIYIEDEREHLSDGSHVARIEHQCNECKRIIGPGETYRFWTFIDREWDDKPRTEKMCAHCWNTIELGASFTGCPKSWYWEAVHRLRDDGYEASFVADILGEHDGMTVAQRRAMVRCVRHFRKGWRDADGELLPLVQAAAPGRSEGES